MTACCTVKDLEATVMRRVGLSVKDSLAEVVLGTRVELSHRF